MRDADELRAVLEKIDGRGYGAYHEVKGEWTFSGFRLLVDYIQGDPFAAPTRMRTVLSPAEAGLDEQLLSSPARRIGVSCRLGRAFAAAARRQGGGRGSGRSGEIRIASAGQEVLPNTAVLVDRKGGVEARFRLGLPAKGRRILGEEAKRLLLEVLPDLVAESLRAAAFEADDLLEHARMNEDAEALRAALTARNLVAFVADGARLPRRSGVDDRPLGGSGVVPFRSPDSLRVTIPLPNRGEVEGMGIPHGVSLIVGGGYHGKSTLLGAIERGVYNHRPGDGRELVVSVGDAVKVRAEEGRPVTAVDVSPFIGTLPGGIDTARFSTEDASGSTSQAAAIMEALEVGASALLIDEDTAATNFLIRDRRMQALVPKEREPITPFIDRVRGLFEDRGVSSILVLGGSGDYLEVADTVIALHEYVPEEVTERARAVAERYPTGRLSEQPEGGRNTFEGAARIPLPSSIDPAKGRREVYVRPRGERRLEFGRSEIQLAAVEQIVSREQLRSIGGGLALARAKFFDGRTSLPDAVARVIGLIEGEDGTGEGLDSLSDRRPGDLAWIRPYELAAALNRLRGLLVAEGPDG